MIHDDDTLRGRCSPPQQRMQHVYPDVIIVDRGGAGKAATTDVDSNTAMSRRRHSDDHVMKLHHVIGDVTAEDDVSSASLKDYTYMYRKDDEDETMSGNSAKLPCSEHDACSDISSVSSSIGY